jgi:hypothetical protein
MGRLNNYIDVFVTPLGVVEEEDALADIAIVCCTWSTRTRVELRPLMSLSEKARDLRILWYSDVLCDCVDLTPVMNVLFALQGRPNTLQLRLPLVNDDATVFST